MSFEMKLLDEQASNLILKQRLDTLFSLPSLFHCVFDMCFFLYREECLLEEQQKLRDRIAELEKQLSDSLKKNELLARLLDEEKAARRTEVSQVSS